MFSGGYEKKKVVGVDDMVLISKLTPDAINDNLKNRHVSDSIYVIFFTFNDF